MNKKQKELETDMVVIGTGASGLCAALTADFGGVDVILLEKMPSRGGMSNFAEGLFAVETKIQKINKIGITVEQAFKNHMENTHWLANSRNPQMRATTRSAARKYLSPPPIMTR